MHKTKAYLGLHTHANPVAALSIFRIPTPPHFEILRPVSNNGTTLDPQDPRAEYRRHRPFYRRAIGEVTYITYTFVRRIHSIRHTYILS